MEIPSHILVLLCGLPASGKTEFAKRLEKCQKELLEALRDEYKTDSDSIGSLRISCVHFDAHLRDAIAKNGNKFTPETWKLSRVEALQELEYTLRTSSSSVSDSNSDISSSCRLIIVDDNMNYTSMRKQIFDIAFQYQCGFVQILIDTPVDVCIKRNACREGDEKVSEKTIRSMPLEHPGSSSKWWDTNVVAISGSEDSQVPFQPIAQCSRLPSPPITSNSAIATSINASSFIHQLDLECRKLVGRQIKESNGKLSSEFSRLKQLFLAQSKAEAPTTTGVESHTLDEMVATAALRFGDELRMFALLSSPQSPL